MNDLRTFILDLAERKPDMRVKSLAQEIKKFDTTQHLKQATDMRIKAEIADPIGYHRATRYGPVTTTAPSPDRRNWLERFASYFSARGY